MKVPIRLRMTAWYVALLGAVVAALGAFLVFQLRADLTSAVDDGLRPATHEIARDVHDEGPPEFPDAARTVLKGERATGQLLTANGSVARRFGDAVNARPIVAPGAGEGIVTRRLDGQDFRVATLPVRGQGRIYVIVAGQSLAPVARSVRRVVILLLLAGPAALLTIALGGWWLARRALRPVNEITTAAEAIGGDRLGDRVPVPRADDELAHLARTLNTMLARIEHGAEEQRRLVADASHELRTPLAAMRAEIDVSLRADDLSPAARGVLLSAREEVDRLSRTVDDLLTIGAADDGALEMGREVTDLGHLVRTVASTLEPLARDRDVTVTASGPAVVATADPLRLGRALRNVVENAIEFSSQAARCASPRPCARAAGASSSRTTDLASRTSCASASSTASSASTPPAAARPAAAAWGCRSSGRSSRHTAADVPASRATRPRQRICDRVPGGVQRPYRPAVLRCCAHVIHRTRRSTCARS